MANSRFSYVRSFELPDPLLPNTHLVLRIDGHAFHKFSDAHEFAKPNDERALQLMDKAAQTVMEEYPDIVLGFGESDEFRQNSKIVSMLTSLFTSAYVFNWTTFFPDTRLQYPPSFDGRIVVYPGKQEIRDYFAWRQADTHINNLYNTTFWALVQKGGLSAREAETRLKGTLSKDKHEILFSSYEINYNTLPERFKKGSVLVREIIDRPPLKIPTEGSQGDEESVNPASVADDTENVKVQTAKSKRGKTRAPPTAVNVIHVDIIKDEFWSARPELLE